MEKKNITSNFKEEDTVLVNQVNKFFITQKCKNDERNLELIKFKKGNIIIKRIQVILKIKQEYG